MLPPRPSVHHNPPPLAVLYAVFLLGSIGAVGLILGWVLFLGRLG